MQPDYDILIIGAGMAGASLACALAPTGLRVGVVEAVPIRAGNQPSYDDRSVALAWGSKRIFETMGVWSAIAGRSAAPIERIHISDRGRFGFTRLDARDAGVEALGYVVENRVLGAALMASMEGHPNLELICPATVVGVHPGADAAELVVGRDGAETRLTTRLTVVADGGRSRVRELMGITARATDYGQTAVVANVSPEKNHRHVAYERFTATGPLALLPMTDNRCSLVWSVRPEQVEKLLQVDDAEFLGRLHARFGERLGRFVRVGRRNAYPLSLIKVDRHVRPRAALIGNAAHALHPVAGQGFNLGLRDVAALAQVVADAHRAGRDIGELAVLDHYAAWRRRDNLAMTTFTDGLVRIFSNEFLPLALARNTGLIAVDLLPPLKRSLARLSMGVTGRLPRLARGLPL